MRLLYALRDQDPATTKSVGILNASLALLHGLARRPEVTRLDVLANASLAPLLPAVSDRVRVHLAGSAAPRRWARLAWDQWQLAGWARRLRPDWLLLPKGFFPLLREPGCRVSAFVHDNIFGHYAKNQPGPFSAVEAALFHRALARTATRADAIVTNSAFTAGEISGAFRCRARPVPIGLPLLDAPKFPSPTAETSTPPAVLLLTSPYPHKLTALAVDWLARLDAETPGGLAVTGVGALPAGLRWPERPGWKRHARLGAAEFARVRADCSMLAYFSAYEGFGLPPLEMLHAGRRAVASDLPPLRENLPAEILFSNASYESFCATVRRALAHPPPAVRPDEPETVAARWLAVLRGAEKLPSPDATGSLPA